MQAHSRHHVPRGLPLREDEIPEPPLRLVGRAVRPSAEETRRNPRARSATLRVVERTAGLLSPNLISNLRIEPGARWRN